MSNNETFERPPVVSQQEWLAAHQEHLKQEKALTRAYDELRRARQRLPWVRLEKSYVFDGPDGKVTLDDLFAGRNQLIVTHFMFGPEWQEGCIGCSFGADHVDPILVHLENHGVSYAVVSRGPLAKLQEFRKRMGWQFKWVSSADSDFNFDFHVSFRPEEIAKGEAYYNFAAQPVQGDEASGMSVFYRDTDGTIYHTASVYGRGGEKTLATYMLLDWTPLGRNEKVSLMDWVKHHDRYAADRLVSLSRA